MKILIDKEILLAEEAFSTIGEVTLQAGSEIDHSAVKDKDLLVIRTTTKVNAELLSGSQVKYIATATSGTDHIDLDYLQQQGIGFGTSAGCNAVAVAEFVINALIRYLTPQNLRLEDQILGIIGVGHTGSALESKASKLGIECLLNDPPRAETFGDKPYIGLDELLSRSTIISFHVPLTKAGSHPTLGLLNQENIRNIKPGTIIVNACRGGVIEENALLKRKNELGGFLLDVWENEPNINLETLKVTNIATPHIAGYSYEAKVKATAFAYDNACRHFGFTPCFPFPMKPESGLISVTPDKNDFLSSLVTKTYDIFSDDQAMRKLLNQGADANYFRSLRNNYDFRREFSTFRIDNPSDYSPEDLQIASSLGFQCDLPQTES